MGDISKLPDSYNTFPRMNNDGLIEIVCEETGDIIAVQRSIKDLMPEKNDKMLKLTLHDGRTVLYEKGISLDQSGIISGYKFDEVVAGVICQRIAEGARITRLHEDGLPPYSIICKWRAVYPQFAKMVEIAMRDRAHVFADKAVDAAESAQTKDDAVVQRLKTDTYKWIAEKSSPDEYGNKTQVRGDASAPFQLIVDTGVPAPEDRVVESNVIEIKGKNVGAAPTTEDS
jgi:hypothetical protein